MVTPTFSVFLDPEVSQRATPKPTTTSSSKLTRAHREISQSTTKENINPLTGVCFDSTPPFKKRKPSSSSALRAKSLPSKSGLKSKKLGNSMSGKERAKKRTVLGPKSTLAGAADEYEETSFTALANRRAFEFTVMPLADVTQAYDETEAFRAGVHAALSDSSEEVLVGTPVDTPDAVPNESNDIQMSDATSKEELQSTSTATVITA